MCKVEQFHNKNQFIIFGNGSVTFQSYNSTIAVSDKSGLTLGLHWDYSKTTLKHLYLFLNDYDLDIYQKIMHSNNKRKELQKLIDSGVIKYDENMQ